MEEKNNEKHPHPHRRRRRPNNGGNGNEKRGNSQEGTSRSNNGGGSNGGYTKANQNPNRSKNRNNSHNTHNSHNSHNAHSGKKQNAQASRPRKKGYQPDTGKDAIRSFILGTCEEEGPFYVFSFDRGTYKIQKGAIPVIPDPEEPDLSEDVDASADIDPNVPAEKGTSAEPAEDPLPPRKEDFFDKENAEELLLSRDKVLAYQTWNEIKRPKKGKGLKAEAKAEE